MRDLGRVFKWRARRPVDIAADRVNLINFFCCFSSCSLLLLLYIYSGAVDDEEQCALVVALHAAVRILLKRDLQILSN